MADAWMDALQSGDADAAWDRFLEQYRRLLFAIIHRHATDPDVVMDLFADACEKLHANRLARLTQYHQHTAPRAAFSSWLAVVVRNLVVDWYRQRLGRRREAVPAGLSPLGQALYRHVFIEQRSHAASYELLRQHAFPGLALAAFREELRAAHRVAFARSVVTADTSLEVEPSIEMPPHVEEEESRRILRASLQALPPDLRSAVWLFAVEGSPAAEVARIVGWPDAKSVYNRVGRALDRLRADLKARGLDMDAL